MQQTQESSKHMLSLFQAFEIELEYMVVDRHSLQIQPITDQLFYKFANEYISDIEHGPDHSKQRVGRACC